MKPIANKIVIFNTALFIDHLRTNKFKNHIQNLQGLIRNSSVVLSELLRGATKKEEKAFVEILIKNYPILTPTEKNWIESGEILWEINKNKGLSPEKLRDMHFDDLIAATARNYGATVITSNKSDFELIKGYKNFNLLFW